MANETCKSLLKVALIRAVRLDAAGDFVTSATAAYESNNAMTIGFTGQVPDREEFELRGGEGDVCAKYIGPAQAVDSAELSTTLCVLDSELIEMLAGGTVITDAGDSVGYLSPTDSSINEDGVALEFWTYAWAGRRRAVSGSDPLFWRFGLPKTTWQVGEIAVNAEGFTEIPLTGIAEANDSFGTGPDTAWPTAFGDSVYGWFLDTDPPVAQCGYTAYPLAS